jgi:SAM-dependent methyltransferase
MDVVDLREFYASPLGRAGCGMITAALAKMVRAQADQQWLGLGYATPYLDQLVPDESKALAFMLARQGVTHWPRTGNVRSALIDECDLPLLESTVDHALVVHGLELAEAPLDTLQEIWRVMAPQGHLYIVVPNRLGLWSATDSSPFGYGQPFSRSQLAKLLREAQFSVVQWRHALYMPPSHRRTIVNAGRWIENFGGFAATRFSGVIIVEAMKQVYAFSSGKRTRRLVSRMRPVLLPSPHQARRDAE